jgi:peptidoglycan-associated lipoprotein
MMQPRMILVSVLLTGLTVAACRREEPAPPPPPPPAAVARPPQPNLDSLQRYNDSVRAAQAAAAAAAQALAQRVQAARDLLSVRVHFDYDQSTLTPAAMQVLNQKLPILRASPAVTMRLEGHADERGSNEYNLALGNRRAQAILEFFTQNGLAATRFQTTSFGEERPLQAQSNEAAWAQNRRVEFVLTAGQNQINPAP